jgi:hypothetical protein
MYLVHLRLECSRPPRPTQADAQRLHDFLRTRLRDCAIEHVRSRATHGGIDLSLYIYDESAPSRSWLHGLTTDLMATTSTN